MKTPRLYLMAGGKSRRFGQDKARVPFCGTSVLAFVADALREVVADVTVVAASANAYSDLGFRTIADERMDQGPLAGLEAALRDAGKDRWVLVVSCDLVFIQKEWVGTLSSQIGTGDMRAIAFRHDFWEPLCAMYHGGLLEKVSECLDRGERSMQKFLEGCGAHAIALPADWPENGQTNTPEELAAFEQQIQRRM